MNDHPAARHTCAICGGVYHATPTSEKTHRTVHGHYPRPKTDGEPTR